MQHGCCRSIAAGVCVWGGHVLPEPWSLHAKGSAQALAWCKYLLADVYRIGVTFQYLQTPASNKLTSHKLVLISDSSMDDTGAVSQHRTMALLHACNEFHHAACWRLAASQHDSCPVHGYADGNSHTVLFRCATSCRILPHSRFPLLTEATWSYLTWTAKAMSCKVALQ